MRYPCPPSLSKTAGQELATSPHWGPTLENINHTEVEHAPSLQASKEALPKPPAAQPPSPLSPPGHRPGPAFPGPEVCDRLSEEATSPLGDR